MAVKIRLQRHGRKGKPFYHVVVADARAPRDGRFIERIGSYNPNTNPATVEIDSDKAIDWLNKGAQPTDTARAILSYRGIMLRQYLLRGVGMGFHTEEEAEAKLQTWLQEKEAKVEAKRTGLTTAAAKNREERMAAETKVNQDRAKELAQRRQDMVASAAAAQSAATAESASQTADATETADAPETAEE